MGNHFNQIEPVNVLFICIMRMVWNVRKKKNVLVNDLGEEDCCSSLGTY